MILQKTYILIFSPLHYCGTSHTKFGCLQCWYLCARLKKWVWTIWNIQ